MAASRREYPPLFHRIFLGHLLMVLLCFVIAVVLLDYLFVEGLALYMQRTPLILIPVALALIGLAGLSALWTAGSAALPLDRITRLLDGDASPDALLAEHDRVRTEENANLLTALHGRLTRQANSGRARPLYMQIDSHLNIIATDAETAALLGAVPEEMTAGNLRSYLHEDSDVTPLLGALGDPPATRELEMRFRAAGARTLRARAVLHPLGMNRWLLLSNDLRKG
jgi:hypothetical protein